jgi:glycosyltransferase involved in cell wall biosynthesis
MAGFATVERARSAPLRVLFLYASTRPRPEVGHRLVRSGVHIHSLVEGNLWQALPSAESAPPRVLAAGRLRLAKPLRFASRASALLVPDLPGLEIVFVGRSSLRNGPAYKDWLVKLARKVQAPCRFVEHELGAWYVSSRVVALCSRYDNLSVRWARGDERWSTSRRRTGTGTAEIMEGAGTVVPVNDAESLAAALRRYLTDASAVGRAGDPARSVVGRYRSPALIAGRREASYWGAVNRWRERVPARSRAFGSHG